jgi:hypothetical protein
MHCSKLSVTDDEFGQKATGGHIGVMSVPVPVADNGFAALLLLAVLCL